MYTKEKVEKAKNEKSNLEQCVVLWKNNGKSGEYLSGRDNNTNKVVGFFQKNENPKAPNIRVFSVDEETNKIGIEILALWESTSKNGKKYLIGRTNEKENLICFYGSNENNQPYLTVYFKID